MSIVPASILYGSVAMCKSTRIVGYNKKLDKHFQWVRTATGWESKPADEDRRTMVGSKSLQNSSMLTRPDLSSSRESVHDSISVFTFLTFKVMLHTEFHIK